MYLVQFNDLLPPFGTTTPTYADYKLKSFWVALTCSGWRYEARSTKATWICNSVIRYLQHLTLNHVFPQANSQNGVRAGELFILWAALHRKTVNTGPFLVDHLDEHAKSTKVVIGGGCIIMTLVKALWYAIQVDDLSILYRPGYTDLITCINIKLFKVLSGGQLWLNHHGHALFALHNHAKTTIICPSNLVYHDEVDGESRGESNGSGDDDRSDNDDVEKVPRGQSGRRRAPPGPSALAHLALLLPLLLGPWVPPCFRRFPTILMSCKSKITQPAEDGSPGLLCI